METGVVKIHPKAVMLDSSTQIEIYQLRSKGKSYLEIDELLEVPLGSSEFTIAKIRERYHGR